MIDLIYCGSGNRYLEKIARDCGFKYGLRLPQTKLQNYNLYFSDQDYKRPNKNKYIEFVKMYTPFMATVIDIEKYEQFSEAVEWANEISDFVNTIIFIPKCKNVIEKLPRFIKNKKIILGLTACGSREGPDRHHEQAGSGGADPAHPSGGGADR